MGKAWWTLILVCAALFASAPAAAAPTTQRVGITPSGTEFEDGVGCGNISGDGRFVVFLGKEDGMFGDPGHYIRDLSTGQTTLLAMDSAYTDEGSGGCPSISDDGRFVAFGSNKPGFDPTWTARTCYMPPDFTGWLGGAHPCYDVYVRDRGLGTTTRISLALDGSEGDGSSWLPRISANGRYVMFTSMAGNLVPGDTNGMEDTYVYDRIMRTLARTSPEQVGGLYSHWSGRTISANGRYVMMHNEVERSCHEKICREYPCFSSNTCFSAWFYDTVTGRLVDVAQSSSGVHANDHAWPQSVSADGRQAFFLSGATNIGESSSLHVFVRDTSAGTTSSLTAEMRLCSCASIPSGSWSATATPDGRYVALHSGDRLVAEDTNTFADTYFYDRSTRSIALVSATTSGSTGNGTSVPLAISQSGRWVLFNSEASDMVPSDNNTWDDIFLRGPFDAAVAATPVPEAPTTPAATTGAGPGQVSLAWSAPSPNGSPTPTHYRVYRRDLVGGPTVLAATVGDVRAYTDTHLVGGRTYAYRIDAVNVYGEGMPSPETTAVASANTLPGAPSITQTMMGDGSVTVRWNPPANDGGRPITTYRVFAGDSAASQTLIGQSSTTTFTETGLGRSQTRYYRVSAVTDFGEGPLSSAVPGASWDGKPPAKPHNLTASHQAQGRIRLSWISPAGNLLSGFRIYRGFTPGSEIFLAETGTLPSFVDTTCPIGRVCFYVVRAFNAGGESDDSNEAFFLGSALILS